MYFCELNFYPKLIWLIWKDVLKELESWFIYRKLEHFFKGLTDVIIYLWLGPIEGERVVTVAGH